MPRNNLIPNEKISAHDWATLQEALRLSPSSAGLQPWKFVVITDPAMRAKASARRRMGNLQITDASHLVVFAAKKEVFKRGRCVDEVSSIIPPSTRGVPVTGSWPNIAACWLVAS